MYKRNEIEDFLNCLASSIEKRVYGIVHIESDLFLGKHILYIRDRDIKCSFDLTDSIYSIKTNEDAEKLEYDIMQQYKSYILGAYIVE